MSAPGSAAEAAPRAGHEGKLRLALVLTASYVAAEVVGGLLTGSLSLLSDAAQMSTDVTALTISLLALRIAKRPADQRRTFGYARLEVLAAVLNAAVLLAAGVYVLTQAYRRFVEPVEVQALPMLIVALGGLAVNLFNVRMLRESSEESLNVKGAYLEVLSDTLGSVAVVVAALVIRFTGLTWVDPLLGALIGLWVFPRTFVLLSEAVHVLLEGVPRGVELAKIQAQLEALPGVRGVHELHVWAISGAQNSLTAHLVVDGTPDLALVREAQRVAAAHGIEHTSIQLDDAETVAAERGVHARWR